MQPEADGLRTSPDREQSIQSRWSVDFRSVVQKHFDHGLIATHETGDVQRGGTTAASQSNGSAVRQEQLGCFLRLSLDRLVQWRGPVHPDDPDLRSGLQQPFAQVQVSSLGGPQEGEVKGCRNPVSRPATPLQPGNRPASRPHRCDRPGVVPAPRQHRGPRSGRWSRPRNTRNGSGSP